jgi:hypothetical protein
MTLYDIIAERAQLIIMTADYTTTPPQSPQLALMRERYPLSMSIPDIDEMLWREAERLADEVIFGRVKP